MLCAGCGEVIEHERAPRVFQIERLAFCGRPCFDEHAPALVRTLLTVVRHIATSRRSKFRHVASMALSNPYREVPLL